MTTCIDLAARYGAQYRIGYEEQKRETPRAEWPWLARIRCKYGWVGVHGGDVLQAYTNRSRIGSKLRALPFVTHARGDTEVIGRFHVDHLPEILALLQPRKRRQPSEAERERLRGLSARHGYGAPSVSEGAERPFKSTQGDGLPAQDVAGSADAMPPAERQSGE